MDLQIIWDDEPGGNVEHVAEHDLTVDEVDEVLRARHHEAVVSRTTGSLVCFGFTSTGRHIAVVFDRAGDDPPVIVPRTAYDTPPPAGKPKRRKKR